MNIDDFSFEIEDNGKKYKCDVLEVVPNDKSKDEPFVVYTNYDLNENDEFVELYGKLIEEDGKYNIISVSDEEEKYIDETRKNEVVKYVNNAIKEAIDE